MMSAWDKRLHASLIKSQGKKHGEALYTKYAHAFSPSYQNANDADMAVKDIVKIEGLSADKPNGVTFYEAGDEKDYPLHLRLYQWQEPTPLSDILPILENLDLRTYDEHPYKLRPDNQTRIWIRDFSISYNKASINIEEVNQLFEDAVLNMYFGRFENDGFNKLIIGATLSWHQIIILRAYAKYLHQINFHFSQSAIELALVKHVNITRDLVALFETLHTPIKIKQRKIKAREIRKRILNALEAVSSLDEDRIIRAMLKMIKATVRTNFFKKNIDGSFKESVALKLDSKKVPDIPLPVPLYEIFVYSPRFEAIHLRTSMVARGGLRWSDRREDFRTEILGLMKAQKVKNAVIVPSGAKGGFVLKSVMPNATREEIQGEVIDCYKAFISGMLDITDNIKNKKTIPPKGVVCHDAPDPYLVVAADKGTATFSDIANSVSDAYGFWLGDAFASGGSAGYDHKKMGITARGAWESVKRHFRELDVDLNHEDITVIGVGDMSGDVFGNGMLCSDHIKLIAAFDHRHIFIDPTPNSAKSYKERKRMFKLTRSSWDDYNKKLISKGGGVFSRSLKSIKVTPQMKKALGITDNKLTPNEMIRAILRAPVDLLFNGGIGTYVKATSESKTDVGDRANDYTRVNGNELRCKVVGEGGNLGLTQLGRVEYALNGGLVNSDFIDNSAGVDCSDHEVNLKILLGTQIANGKLKMPARNKLLASLTNEIAELVLHDNYQQALVMSFSAFHAKRNMSLHQNYIKELEDIGILDRHVEQLPDDKHLLERKAAGLGLTRPELAVLLAYSKMLVKQEILNSDLTERDFFGEVVTSAFPPAIRKKYTAQMRDHQLYREILATQLANKVINQMGMTFVFRMQMQTGASVPDIIRAHAISSHIFGTTELQNMIESLDYKIDMATQYDMLFHVRNLLNLSTRWFLLGDFLDSKVLDTIKHYSNKVHELEHIIPDLMGGKSKELLNHLVDEFTEAGLPTDIAIRIATYRAIYTALNIIFVSTNEKLDLIDTAKVYFLAGERLNLLWFREQIAHDTREGHWNNLARLTLRDELDVAQRELTTVILRGSKKGMDTETAINEWIERNKIAIDRWEKLLAMVHASNSVDYTMFFIAMRELLGMLANSK